MNRIKLSENFYLDEFTRSETAARNGITINVTEGSEVYINLKRLCTYILQPLRDNLGPVHVLSGYRPASINKLIGGAKKSQHITGQAADIVVSNRTPLEVAKWIYANCEDYDQIINEFGQWVHVSVSTPDQWPRNQIITAVKKPRLLQKPKTIYVAGLSSIEEAMRLAS